MGDKDTLAAKFRAAVQRAEADARRKVEEAERAIQARETLMNDLAAFAEQVGVLEAKRTAEGIALLRGEKVIRFERGEGSTVVVKLIDRELPARFVNGAWHIGEGPTAKDLWEDGLAWLLVHWLDLPNPGGLEEPAAAPAEPAAAPEPPPAKGGAPGAGKSTAPAAEAPTATRKGPTGNPGSRLQELKNPWD